MRVKVDGQLAPGVSSKDIILHVIGKIGTAGGTGAVIEYCGSTIEELSMEGRMSIVSSPRVTTPLEHFPELGICVTIALLLRHFSFSRVQRRSVKLHD